MSAQAPSSKQTSGASGAADDPGATVEGRRCEACGRSTALPLVRCPRCHAVMVPARFGPEGVVWSSTVVHLDALGHEAPYALAYLDLDDGPRVLVHVRRPAGAQLAQPAIGTRLRLAGRT